MSIVLQPWFNALLVAFWLGVAGAVAAWSPTFPSIETMMAAACAGVVAGLLQGCAVLRERLRFRAATTATQVREALLATIPGKASLILSWVVLGCMLLFSAREQGSALATAVCSLATYQAIRELISLPAVVRLSHEPRQH